MPRQSQQRVLLIGDGDRQLQAALAQAMPGAIVRHAAGIFDGIAELSDDHFGAVFSAVEPVGRRPEAAVRTLRELAGDGRLVLFGDASLEPLSRRMLQFGCDDYLITPVSPTQIHQILSATPPGNVQNETPMRLHTDYDDPRQAIPQAKPPLRPAEIPLPPVMAETKPAAASAGLQNLSLDEIVLEALLEHPGDATAYAVNQLNQRLGSASIQLTYSAPAAAPPHPPVLARNNRLQLTQALQSAGIQLGWLTLTLSSTQEGIGQTLLSQIAPLLTKTAAIQRRQARLQKLAFTDDLTGLFNCRYFKHFLARILGEARKNRFPVTLFLFDIDNFKHYNDRFGHGVGDDILKQTSDLMRRCVRDHDLVARIGGDEFAVIFWEKEGPRAPRDSATAPYAAAAGNHRPPSEPQQILARFRRLLESQNYPLLGSTGRGTLTISGGLAVFPYDAGDMHTLIEAADKALMFGAKRSGRNSIALVGGEQPGPM